MVVIFCWSSSVTSDRPLWIDIVWCDESTNRGNLVEQSNHVGRRKMWLVPSLFLDVSIHLVQAIFFVRLGRCLAALNAGICLTR
jgi:hypothetical protein